MIDSGCVVVSKCDNALNGTAPFVIELGVPADPAPPAVLAVLDRNAFTGGTKVFAEGVNSADPVSAFVPAELDPLLDEVAGAPLVPAAEPARI